MEIALDTLGADAFSLELPSTDQRPSRRLVLGDVVGLRGGLHTEPGLVQLINAEVDRGRIDGIAWPLFGGLLSSSQPISLVQVAVNADFPSAQRDVLLSGNATAKDLSALSLHLGVSTFQCTADIRADNVVVQAGDGELGTRFEKLRLDNLQFQVGELLIRGALEAAGLRTTNGKESPLTILATSAAALELSLVHPRAEVTAAGVELPKGLAFKGGDLRIDEIHVGAMRVLIPLEASADAEGPKLALVDDVVCLGERKLIDLRDIDRVAGHGEIAVFVKAQLPVVGSYKLERTFKIPIKDGHIDFVDVERQLGTIEDAFIDFAVRDRELIIKRDIPLLPTKGKKLVGWPLTTVEEALARTRLVSLRTLTRFEMVKAKEGDSKATISAVKIDVPALTLTLPRPSDDGRDSCDAEIGLRAFDPISMAGSLRLESKGNSRELDASVRGNAVEFSVQGLALGTSELSASAIRCGEIVLEVAEWDGMRPLALALEIKDLAIDGLSVRASKSEPS